MEVQHNDHSLQSELLVVDFALDREALVEDLLLVPVSYGFLELT
jgi:hypothetical protein